MKHLFFFLCVISSALVLGQPEENTSNTGAYSEIGLYTMDKTLDVKQLTNELKAIYPDATFILQPPETIDKTMILLSPVTNIAEEYPVYSMEYLNYFAKGFSEEQKQRLTDSKNALMCVLFYPKDNALAYNKKFDQWIYKTIQNTEYVAYDGETREYFTSDTWKIRRYDAWQDLIPDASQYITVHSYRKETFCRSITLGMQRFGFPDFVIENSPCSNIAQANQLLNIIAQFHFEGKRIKNAMLSIDLNALKNTQFKNAVKETCYENATEQTLVSFKKGTREEGDPYNILLEVDFDSDRHPNPQAYQDEIYAALFGSEDEVTHVDHNKEILAASERAKKRLPAMRKLFNKGLGANYNLLLKAPFETDTGGNEWMWIEVTKWEGETIEGILQNEPHYIKGLKSGTKVTVQQADIFDYILRKADGTFEGNETGKLIMKYGN